MTVLPPQSVLSLWTQVKQGVVKQTVGWKAGADALEKAHEYYATYEQAQEFARHNALGIMKIFLQQLPNKIGANERACVERAASCTIDLIIRELFLSSMKSAAANNAAPSEESLWWLTTLCEILNPNQKYYKGVGQFAAKNNSLAGLPALRSKLVARFVGDSGPLLLTERMISVLQKHAESPIPFKFIGGALHKILSGAVVPRKDLKEASLDLLVKTVLAWINAWSDDYLEQAVSNSQRELDDVQDDLRKTFRDKPSRRETELFLSFWTDFVLRLVSFPLADNDNGTVQCYGWRVLDRVIAWARSYRPPPRAIVVSGAGNDLCNGVYEYDGKLTEDGYAIVKDKSEVAFSKTATSTVTLDGEAQQKNKRLKLFQVTLRDQRKHWYLSEPDEKQPGSDHDIDYYDRCKSGITVSREGSLFPPSGGWKVCRTGPGIEPAPTMQPDGRGLVMPPDAMTMEQQLVQWALELQWVLGNNDADDNPRVSVSPGLIDFLEGMQTEFPADSHIQSSIAEVVEAYKKDKQEKEQKAAKEQEEKMISLRMKRRKQQQEIEDSINRLSNGSDGDLTSAQLQGLLLLGGTGYMDGVLHQLFLCRPLRKLIIQVFGREATAVKLNNPHVAVSVALRDLFLQIENAVENNNDDNFAATDAAAEVFIEACSRSLQLEYHIRQPNDASEFAAKLMDRINVALYVVGGDEAAKTMLRNLASVTSLKQKICRECQHKVERGESFAQLDLQTRGKASVEDSLSTMTSSEVMEGNNKVHCDKCKCRTDTVLRTVLDDGKLPHLLCLSLKRFDLDYNTFELIKLNHNYTFPERLDMAPYTTAGFVGSLPYDLVGVVVHEGTAGGGFYFSLMRIRETKNRWVKTVGGGSVEEVSADQLGPLCHGGDHDPRTKANSSFGSNAVMVYYERAQIVEEGYVVV